MTAEAVIFTFVAVALLWLVSEAVVQGLRVVRRWRTRRFIRRRLEAQTRYRRQAHW